jgi:hypothetical protein
VAIAVRVVHVLAVLVVAAVAAEVAGAAAAAAVVRASEGLRQIPERAMSVGVY